MSVRRYASCPDVPNSGVRVLSDPAHLVRDLQWWLDHRGGREAASAPLQNIRVHYTLLDNLSEYANAYLNVCTVCDKIFENFPLFD